MIKRFKALVNTKGNAVLVAFFACLLIPAAMFAQGDEAAMNCVTIGGGAGISIFNGDVGNGSDVSSYSRIRPGYHFTLEKRFGKFIGIELGGLIGNLSQSEKSKTNNYNFETPIKQGSLSLVLHFDNNVVFKTTSAVTPYLFAGVGYMMFDPHGDLLDANGVKYNYWSDGSIRDLPETPANLATAKNLQRDYVYETQLKDTVTSYARNTITMPVGIGFKLKFSDHLHVDLGLSYHFTMTDYLDNLKKDGNDGYLYSFVSFKYSFYRRAESKDQGVVKYKDVDYSKIDKADSDGDGISDVEDNCQNTPKGVKVDSKGCPVDSDGDAIPDYLDKEVKSKKGAIVDENGVTLTDAMIAERAKRDSLARERETVFNAAPSLETLKKIEQEVATKKAADASANKPATKLPAKFQFADRNTDGIISSDEITAAIDAFFEGSADVTVERLNELIDYFFEQ